MGGSLGQFEDSMLMPQGSNDPFVHLNHLARQHGAMQGMQNTPGLRAGAGAGMLFNRSAILAKEAQRQQALMHLMDLMSTIGKTVGSHYGVGGQADGNQGQEQAMGRSAGQMGGAMGSPVMAGGPVGFTQGATQGFGQIAYNPYLQGMPFGFPMR